jgi:signal transduction histidine kinase
VGDSPPQDDDLGFEAIGPNLISFGISLLRYAAMVGAYGSTLAMFQLSAPRVNMMLCEAAVLALLAIWAATIAIIQIRRPQPVEILRLWRPIGKALLVGNVVCITMIVWLLMPYGSEAIKPIIAIFAMGYVAVVIVSTAEHSPVNRAGAVIILGSIVIVYARYGSGWQYVIIGYAAMFAALMYFLGSVFPNALKEATLARRAAESEHRAKARFLASVSHDLGQPLQAARLFFNQAMRAPDALGRQRAVQGVNLAFDTTEHLVHQMLDHLQLESHSVVAKTERIAIGSAIAWVAEVNEPPARAAKVEIRAMPSSLAVAADARLLERALGNLVANAVRHARSERILIGARKHAEIVRIWVIDDGVGVPPADVAVLFEDYVQGSDHGDEIRGGFGLGLSSVRRIAELMAGSCGLDPRWRKGSAFWLELPAA